MYLSIIINLLHFFILNWTYRVLLFLLLRVKSHWLVFVLHIFGFLTSPLLSREIDHSSVQHPLFLLVKDECVPQVEHLFTLQSFLKSRPFNVFTPVRYEESLSGYKMCNIVSFTELTIERVTEDRFRRLSIHHISFIEKVLGKFNR